MDGNGGKPDSHVGEIHCVAKSELQSECFPAGHLATREHKEWLRNKGPGELSLALCLDEVERVES